MKKLFFLLMLLFFVFGLQHAESFAESIPPRAEKYKADLIRSARYEWGLDAPIAVFAAQIHTESLWQKNAKSPAGALGLSQFMPETAAWLPSVMPHVGKESPLNPKWAIRALCAYDRYLFQKLKGNTEYEQMAFALSAYNGGIGWVLKDKQKARKMGLDPFQYFGSVETVNAGRSSAYFRENRRYPFLILKKRQFLYKTWGNVLEDK